MNTLKPRLRIGLVDDRILLRKKIGEYIDTFEDYQVWIEADNGKDFVKQLGTQRSPDLVLLDLDRPGDQGQETPRMVTSFCPEARIVALSYLHMEAAFDRIACLLPTLLLDECLRVSPHLTSKELQFLSLVCSELTYKEIADRMCLSVRTIDGYRDSLFNKLRVRTRVGLAMYALRHGLVLA